MTDQEAFEAWYSEYLSNNTEYPRNQDIWHAALAYLRSTFTQQESGVSLFDGYKVKPLYLAPQPAIPDGWKLVPVEPTVEMLEAAYQELGVYDEYRAMLAAAPEYKK